MTDLSWIRIRQILKNLLVLLKLLPSFDFMSPLFQDPFIISVIYKLTLWLFKLFCTFSGGSISDPLEKMWMINDHEPFNFLSNKILLFFNFVLYLGDAELWLRGSRLHPWSRFWQVTIIKNLFYNKGVFHFEKHLSLLELW